MSPLHITEASDAELAQQCTPTKLKRYIALHLEKCIEHEEVPGARLVTRMQIITPNAIPRLGTQACLTLSLV